MVVVVSVPNQLFRLLTSLKMEPEFWLNFRRNWDLWYAAKKHKNIKTVDQIQGICNFTVASALIAQFL